MPQFFENQSQSPTRGKTIYIIAGEESGDQLGGHFMGALQKQSLYPLRFVGVGGNTMQAQGLESLFDMTELSVMGLVEVLPKLKRLYALRDKVVNHIKQVKPDIIVTIDSPGFIHRVAHKIRSWCQQNGIRHIHYVCPTVWAWRPNRVYTCKAHFDALLALLPFEPPYFEAVGLPCHYVGHSVVESPAYTPVGQKQHSDNQFRNQYGFAPDTPLITVLPGSRRSELKRMLPLYQQAVEQFVSDNPGVQVVIPTLPHLYDEMIQKTALWSVPVTLIMGDDKYHAFRASCCAMATSGTVSLELALTQCPTVIAYGMSPLSYALIKRLLRVPYVSILNIMANQQIVPELIQGNCTVPNLVHHMQTVFNNGTKQINQLAPHIKTLKGPTPNSTPSENAARVVLKYLSPQKNAYGESNII